ncbi:MAG TPA: transposase, partial [Pyrinomonadaceae bacterium]|nr:transposase [Pyrinomonadaceae bacterium]
FFLPVRVLSCLFRGLFLHYLNLAYQRGKLLFHDELEELARPEAFARWLKKTRKKSWVVYAKKPFGGPQQVLDYLGRYTHRVAISNHRLLRLEDARVTFSWKDYRDSAASKLMTLDALEFITRFLLHILPEGFQKIRYFGFMANRHRTANLALCRRLIEPDSPSASPPLVKDWKARYRDLTGEDLNVCPACKLGHLLPVEILLPLSQVFTDSVILYDTS